MGNDIPGGRIIKGSTIVILIAVVILMLLSLVQSGFCATALGEDGSISCYNKGIDLAEQGRYDEAIAEFDRYIQDYPDYARAWYNKGVALTQQGRYDEALTAFERVIDIEPQNSEAWLQPGGSPVHPGKIRGGAGGIQSIHADLWRGCQSLDQRGQRARSTEQIRAGGGCI